MVAIYLMETSFVSHQHSIMVEVANVKKNVGLLNFQKNNVSAACR